MELTTPLAMPDSLPATERTPSLSCDMSGALGNTLVKRYELVAIGRGGYCIISFTYLGGPFIQKNTKPFV